MTTEAPLSLSITDAAYQAGMSYERMRTSVLLGRIEGFREDGKWRVDARSLAEYLAAQTKEGDAPISRQWFIDRIREGPEWMQRSRREAQEKALKGDGND
jgi:hypothetical protein